MRKLRSFGIGVLAVWCVGVLSGSGLAQDLLCAIDEYFVKGPAHGVRTHLEPGDMFDATTPVRGEASAFHVQAGVPGPWEIVSYDWLLGALTALDSGPSGHFNPPGQESLRVDLYVVDTFGYEDSTGTQVYRHGDYTMHAIKEILMSIETAWNIEIVPVPVDYSSNRTLGNIATQLENSLTDAEVEASVVLLNYEIIPCIVSDPETGTVYANLANIEGFESFADLVEEGENPDLDAAFAVAEQLVAELDPDYVADNDPVMRVIQDELDSVAAVVAPAGNWAIPKPGPSAPARFEDVFAVSASIAAMPAMTAWWYPDSVVKRMALMYSNPGQVQAPGGWYAFPDWTGDDVPDHLAGTSLAAPVVATMIATYGSTLGFGAVEMLSNMMKSCSANHGFSHYPLPGILMPFC